MTGTRWGERLQQIRKLRGFRSTQDLAEAIPNVTASVLQNIEAGRRTDITVSQLLNIAAALGVPPVFLLTDIRDPAASPDYPELTQSLSTLSGAAFDSWLSGSGTGLSSSDRGDRSELAAFREFLHLEREISRLEAHATDSEGAELTDSRLQRLTEDRAQTAAFLRACGWTL